MLKPNATDLGIFLRGILMGSADVVPGVSGGTVALIVGIYSRLVGAIASFDATFAKHLLGGRIKQAADHVDWRFLAALGAGIATAILSLAKIITWLILNKPIPTWSLFFGLILASAFLVMRMVDRWTIGAGLTAAAGAALAFWISGLMPGEASHSHLTLFLTGMVAISAMILPGISGSFILVLLGQYLFVLEALHSRDLGVIVVFSAGCGIGLIAFSKVLKHLLSRHHDVTMAFLCGLMQRRLLQKAFGIYLCLVGQQEFGNGHAVFL